MTVAKPTNPNPMKVNLRDMIKAHLTRRVRNADITHSDCNARRRRPEQPVTWSQADARKTRQRPKKPWRTQIVNGTAYYVARRIYEFPGLIFESTRLHLPLD